MRARIGAVGVVVLLLTGLVTAQTGGIAGVVRDASGAALVRSTTTGQNGRHQITPLPVGTYSVTFALAGFTTVKREGVVIAADFMAVVNAELKVNAAAPSSGRGDKET